MSSPHMSGAIGSKAYNGLNTYLQNGIERAIINSVISAPSSVLGVELIKQ